MFAEQRQEKIMRLLEDYQQVEVSSLTSILSASEATVRRDLEKLEHMGLLRRTHGGAILVEKGSTILQAVIEINDPLEEEVNGIGKTASRLIEKGEVVAIGSGAIGLALARNLDKKQQCTILTNDAMIMMELLNHEQTNVIMIGGLARKTDKSIFTSGESTIRMLEEFNVGKAFLCADGISEDIGLTYKEFEYAIIWKKLMQIAEETIIMAISSAFGRRELVRLAPLNRVQRIVTSSLLDEGYKKLLFNHNIPVHMGFQL